MLLILACSLVFQVLMAYAQPGAIKLPVWSTVLVVAMMVPLLVRRRWPEACSLIQTCVYFVLGTVTGVEIFATQVALFLGFYSVGAWSAHRRRAFFTRFFIVIAMAVWLWVTFLIEFQNVLAQHLSISKYISVVAIFTLTNVAYFGTAWYFGNRSWVVYLQARKIRLAHEKIEAQQEELAAHAVALERMRIARELHDVVAHHVTAMGVQAGAARRILMRDPQTAEKALQAVEQSSRSAISELHTMLRTLREDNTDTQPLPTLAQIDDLIDFTRQLGHDVTLNIVDTLPALSPGVELTLYRVAQEALTNSRKHAGLRTSMTVRLRPVEQGVELEVSDSGGRSTAHAAGTGTGVLGMRERVLAVGGTLQVGPKRHGGWMVRAFVPVDNTPTEPTQATSTSQVTQDTKETQDPQFTKVTQLETTP